MAKNWENKVLRLFMIGLHLKNDASNLKEVSNKLICKDTYYPLKYKSYKPNNQNYRVKAVETSQPFDLKP